MNARTRRARRILRSARRGPWGNGRNSLSNAMKPVYGDDGTISHCHLETDPWYTDRKGYYRTGSYRGSNLGPKIRQRWLKEVEKSARSAERREFCVRNRETRA